MQNTREVNYNCLNYPKTSLLGTKQSLPFCQSSFKW